MSTKKSHAEPGSIQWLLERGGEAVNVVLHEVLSRPGVADGLAEMATRAAKTKGQVDKNVETILHLMNLPTRADLQKLQLKVEHLQGSIVNLSLKVDRLLAAQESHREPIAKPKQ